MLKFVGSFLKYFAVGSPSSSYLKKLRVSKFKPLNVSMKKQYFEDGTVGNKVLVF